MAAAAYIASTSVEHDGGCHRTERIPDSVALSVTSTPRPQQVQQNYFIVLQVEIWVANDVLSKLHDDLRSHLFVLRKCFVLP